MSLKIREDVIRRQTLGRGKGQRWVPVRSRMRAVGRKISELLKHHSGGKDREKER